MVATLSEFAGSFSGEDVFTLYRWYLIRECGARCCGSLCGTGCDRECGLPGGFTSRCASAQVMGQRSVFDGVERFRGSCFEVTDDSAGVSGSDVGGGTEHIPGSFRGGVSKLVETADVTESRDATSGGDCDGVRSGFNTRGPNFLRNQANRQAKKRRKQGRREEVLRVDAQEKSGFWNSCSESVRRELIESKAKMHIAENLRKAKESEHRVFDLDSPFNLVQKAVKMIEFAQKQADKTSDSRVHGWAQTVATVSAESLANSVPSSVPSLSEVKDSSSSCVSPDPSLVARIEILELENESLRKNSSKVEELQRTVEELRSVNQRLEDESLEIRVEREIAKTQVSQISSREKFAGKKSGLSSGNVRTIDNYANFPGLHLNKNLKFERFDPKIHTVMTRADVYREF